MYTVQVEKAQQFIDETTEEILIEHWEELALNKDKPEGQLAPQFEEYIRREEEGSLINMVMRTEDTKELVGYFIGFVAPGLHYKHCLTCTMDIFYVRPKFRHNHTAIVRLFRATERELRSRGVLRWFVGTKLHKDVGRLFKALKFEPVEEYFSKWLGD